MDFITQLNILACTKQEEYPSLRKGQSLMSTLYEIDTTIYRKIVGTDNDPFYDDKKLDNFFKFLSQL